MGAITVIGWVLVRCTPKPARSPRGWPRARQLIRSQRDPLAVKRAAEAALTASKPRAKTFRLTALDFLATDALTQFKIDMHRQQWHSTLLCLPRHW